MSSWASALSPAHFLSMKQQPPKDSNYQAAVPGPEQIGNISQYFLMLASRLS